MFAPLLFALLAGTQPGPKSTSGAATYNGRANELHVKVPRIAADIVVDGNLDEPAWSHAAVLTGFSQFSPQDGIPASDSTEVLVWYSATAIHFGIRAFESHGAPHATLADRDHIDADDYVQLLIGTFNDGRQAMVFGVNPLGVQMDGTIVESQQGGGSFMHAAASRQAADLSQDYVFQSKGHVTDWGYEVEIRIPFKSLKYQSADVQSWSFNVVRGVQHAAVEDTWAPARRSAASFLAQSGSLDGLTDLHRGLVVDLNPVVTQKTSGTPSTNAGAWRYSAGAPEFGGNVRWGITNNLTLNATANPDFSQVESDAGQFTFDPRSALYFPEKRPFFLEGMEGFQAPSNLVYTRAIQQPVAAAKLTGTTGGTSIALLSAVDDRTTSLGFDPSSGAGGHTPLYNIARLQRNVGEQSRIGALYTDKEDGGYANRVAELDGRFVFGKLYSLIWQAAGSHTSDGITTTTAPLWGASLMRNGKAFRAQYQLSGMDPGFRADAGFISRPGLAHSIVDHQFTWFAPEGAFLRSVTFDPYYDNIWKYDRFVTHGDAIEKKMHFNSFAQLRGGWNLGFSLLLETFGYDPDLYANYFVERHTGAVVDTVPFTGTPRIPNRDWVVSLGTPQWSQFSMNATYLWGHDENFDEWASSNIVYADVSALIRPTERLRISPEWQIQSYDRPSSGEQVHIERITRIKTEYQVARPLFFRLVGEFRTAERLALRDESRTFDPLLWRNADGTFSPLGAYRRKGFRADWLLSYQPSPGTVFFAGYGSTSAPTAVAFDQLHDARWRTADAFFIKASYLFRL